MSDLSEKIRKETGCRYVYVVMDLSGHMPRVEAVLTSKYRATTYIAERNLDRQFCTIVRRELLN